ncbi:flagellar basal body-associated FliL family protein [Saccharomonospora glauca]|uniref:Flagellar basal body-associated protein FliL n=1 Tax=Saccharomonospora glauca K62 TaxID=928724 RepID=I1D373_9PSEU|nr:hypothetical protein SacglDRAFT_02505 [Saccharomonospora glauca K62]
MTQVSTPEYDHQLGQQAPQHPQQPLGAPPGTAPYGYPAPGAGYDANQQTFPFPQPQPGNAPGPRPPRGKRGLVVGLVIALVLALGGGATWWVLSERESVASGANSPEEAARELFTALGNGDLVGVAQSLAPGEAAALGDLLADSAEELKRLGVLTPDADLSAFSGLRVTASNLTFDAKSAERVNDHVTITKLTGGTLTLDMDLTTLPLAREYLEPMLAAADVEGVTTGSRTLDIGTITRLSGPLRIATVNVDGAWYPSLLYTFTDNLLNELRLSWPRTSIPANGADSPTEAVRQTLQAALDADLNRVIELLPPDEMAVLHDVGPLLVDMLATEGASPTGVKVLDLRTEDTPVANGTLATVTAVELEVPGQGNFSVAKDGDCYTVTAATGESRRVCGAELGEMMAENSDGTTPPEVTEKIARTLAGKGLGVVTTQVDGKHYVSPLRSLGHLGLSLYGQLSPEDFKAMLDSE